MSERMDRDEVARILEIVAKDGLPNPRDLDVALDAIEQAIEPVPEQPDPLAEEMAKKAEKLIDLEIRKLTFEDKDFTRCFNELCVAIAAYQSGQSPAQDGMREALKALADVVQAELDVSPCVGSMAPMEHALGIARAALPRPPEGQEQ